MPFPILFAIDGSHRHEIMLVESTDSLKTLNAKISSLAADSPNCQEFMSKYRKKGGPQHITEMKVRWSTAGREAKTWPATTTVTPDNLEAVLKMVEISGIGRDVLEVKLEAGEEGGEHLYVTTLIPIPYFDLGSTKTRYTLELQTLRQSFSNHIIMMSTYINTPLAKRSLRIDTLNRLLCTALETGSRTPISQTVLHQAKARLNTDYFNDDDSADDVSPSPSHGSLGLKTPPIPRSVSCAVENDEDVQGLAEVWDDGEETLCGDAPTDSFSLASDSDDEEEAPFPTSFLNLRWIDELESPVLLSQSGTPIVDWASILSKEEAERIFLDGCSDFWPSGPEDEPAEYFRSPVLPTSPSFSGRSFGPSPPSFNSRAFQPTSPFFGGSPFGPTPLNFAETADNVLKTLREELDRFEYIGSLAQDLLDEQHARRDSGCECSYEPSPPPRANYLNLAASEFTFHAAIQKDFGPDATELDWIMLDCLENLNFPHKPLLVFQIVANAEFTFRAPLQEYFGPRWDPMVEWLLNLPGMLQPGWTHDSATNDTITWQPEPTVRGTWGILLTCLRKTGWLVVGLVAPELVAFTALYQFVRAKQTARAVSKELENRPRRKTPKERPTEAQLCSDEMSTSNSVRDVECGALEKQLKHDQWSTVQGFYVIMGGIAIDARDSPKQFLPSKHHMVLAP
ncbi:hypothetical protein H2199_002781 [Coniosporium tulheliwenetii]|uniref:Uncharacterized protein n=1 Tax=Coniosporium tulheliwenetii TaxID=3383036 RepID=A0ACC2ZED9_9PEZI|nr:hypothetical protein H2199_002781 [Cladosporium sp. JES 115]